MIDIVINYDKEKDQYKLYEPSSDTIIISGNLTEAFVNLSTFLISNNLTTSDILNSSDINYHLDSFSLIKIIESNVNLVKRLQTAPSGFMISSQKFGGTTNMSTKKSFERKGFSNNGFDKTYKEQSKSKKFSNSSSNFSRNTGFNKANKKFGNKK